MSENNWRQRKVKWWCSDGLLELINAECNRRNTTLSAFIRYSVTKEIDIKRHLAQYACYFWRIIEGCSGISRSCELDDHKSLH